MAKKISVVKIGGNVIDSPEALSVFIKEFAAMEGPKLLVHGGGKLASSLQRQLGQEPQMIDGRRVTDEDTLRVVTMVYAGLCNKTIVAGLQAAGCNAIGLCGADGDAIRSVRRPAVPVDYGFVGDVIAVNGAFLMGLVEQGIVPVICAITHDGQGCLLNTNADTVASEVALGIVEAASDPVRLVYCFEKPGVLYDKDDDSSVIPHISRENFVSLKAEGIVAAGMIPKLENAFKAIDRGVAEVVIRKAENIYDNSGTLVK